MNEHFKYKLYFFIRYLGDSFFYPFFALFLQFKGLGTEKMGIIFAITPLTSMIVNPFWNFLSKNVNSNRKILRVITVLEALIIMIFTQVSLFETIAILTCLIAIFATAHYSLLDGFTSTFATLNKVEYSGIRIYATIAYCVGVFLGGAMLGGFGEKVGYFLMFYLASGLFILSSLLMFWIKPIMINEKETTAKRNYRALFTNIRYYHYSILFILVFATLLLGEGFFPTYLSTKGLSPSNYGYYSTLLLVIEIISIYLITKYGQKFKLSSLFIFSTITVLIKFTAIVLDLPLIFILILAAFRSIGWASVIYFHLKQIFKICRIENVTIAILCLTLVSAVYTAIGSVLSGFLIKELGYQTYYLFIAGVVLVALILYLLTYHLKILQPKINLEEDELINNV